MNKMQQSLESLYKYYLKQIMSDNEVKDAIENYSISSPFLLNVNTPGSNYLNSDYKVIFVGQETNYWFNQIERRNSNLEPINGQLDEYVSALTDLYLRTNNGEKYRTSIFIFYDILRIKILERQSSLGMLNTNLIRHDNFGEGRLPERLINKTAFNENEIFRKEIEILNPDSLVFVSGPNYDRYIRKTYPNVVFEKIENKPLNEIAILKNIPNVKSAVRLYHPSYHNRKGANYKFEIASIVTELLLDI